MGRTGNDEHETKEREMTITPRPIRVNAIVGSRRRLWLGSKPSPRSGLWRLMVLVAALTGVTFSRPTAQDARPILDTEEAGAALEDGRLLIA